MIDANLGRRPVLLIEFDPAVMATLAARYQLTPLLVPGPQPVYGVDAILAGATR